MANKEEKQTLDEAKESLLRMQEFDVPSLSRDTELGQRLNFSPVLPSANRLVELYKRLSIDALQDFPNNVLDKLKNQANNDYSLFNQIAEFDPTHENAANQRQSFINAIESAYQPTFNQLHPLIAYSLHRAADFQRLDRDARATFQSIKDQAAEITKELDDTKEEAKRILEEVREISAEQGVTQQAIYFKEASNNHDVQANQWRTATIWVAIGLTAYAVFTLFFHKIPFMRPSSMYETVQIALSKILVFAVISYMLYLTAKNFLSHKHNSIVNKHRQNALMTYKALVDAAGDTPNRELILNHAAACIFTPQCTGYSSESGIQSPSAKSVVELLTKPLTSTD
jgi:hypothetical protein